MGEINLALVLFSLDDLSSLIGIPTGDI